MRKNKFSESQIFSILKEAEAGIAVNQLCRSHGISNATYYRWKSKYGGMSASDMRRLKELEHENRQLKRMYANASLELTAFKDLIAAKKL